MDISKKENRKKIFKKFDGHCAYCGSDILLNKFQVDHFHPKNRGGSNSFNNLFPCCGSCNSSKSDWLIEDWRNEISSKRKRLENYSATCRILQRFDLVKVYHNKNVKFYFESYGRK
jgi:uncharacterized protein (TIGR02646 family)